jgi:hypothetical protein
MENNTQPVTMPIIETPSKKKRNLIIVGIVFVIIIALVAIFLVRRFTIIAEVSGVLDTVPAAMTAASDASGNGFPVTLPSQGIRKDANVTLKGGGTFDGTVYCVTGTSTMDPTVVYHIDSSSQKAASGACKPVAVVSLPASAPVLALSVIGATQIGVTWPKIDNAASYSLQCATDQGFTQNVTQVTSANTVQDCNNLKSGLGYYARVRANNSAGAGPWSPALTLKTNDWSSAPTATVKPTSSTTATFTWAPVTGATSYIIEWATDTNYLKNEGTEKLTGTSGIITGLKPDTYYYVHVKAVTGEFDAAHAAYSDAVLLQTPAS